ncbi:MAG: N-acetylglucosamine-6-phosphate deacetylase [Planctomycetota bacterium]
MQSTQVIRGATVHTGRPPGAGPTTLRDVAVVLQDGRVAAVVPTCDAPGRGVETLDLDGAHLAPGFIDLQVNGGGGVMWNDDPTVETTRRIARAHRAFGTTALLPTYITGPLEGMRAAAAAAVAAVAAKPEPGGGARILGAHFEGPFLDERKPGAHDVHFLRAPTEADLAAILAPRAAGLEVLLTLAARHFDDATARTLREAGVHVSLGHCASTAAEAGRAFERGATVVTHLFNAMSPLTSREGGLVGAALDAAAAGRARIGLILDGVHVAYDVARVALRAAGPGGVFLVTDAVAPVGAPPGMTSFVLGGQPVTVSAGRCVNADGALAGSALDMASAVRNAVREVGLELDEALRMASTYPAAAVGLGARFGAIAPGFEADLVWFDDDVRVLGTLVAGER